MWDMKKILLILLASFHLEAMANCELLSWRFHTEGVYNFPDKYDMRLFQTGMRDGGVLFIGDLESDLKKNGFFEKKNGRTGLLNNQSLEGAQVSTHESVRGKLTFLRLKEELNGFPSEPLAFISFKDRSIITTGEKFTPEVELPPQEVKNIPNDLLRSLKKTVSKNLNIVEEDIDYVNGKPVKWKSQKLGEKGWKLVQVLTRFPTKNKVQLHSREIIAVDAWIAFLTYDDQNYWYIGNSSGEPCGASIGAQTINISPEGAAEIGRTLAPLYGHRINGKPDELIYSFGDPNIVYYLKFNEMMVIVVNELYR